MFNDLPVGCQMSHSCLKRCACVCVLQNETEWMPVKCQTAAVPLAFAGESERPQVCCIVNSPFAVLFDICMTCTVSSNRGLHICMLHLCIQQQSYACAGCPDGTQGYCLHLSGMSYRLIYLQSVHIPYIVLTIAHSFCCMQWPPEHSSAPIVVCHCEACMCMRCTQ